MTDLTDTCYSLYDTLGQTWCNPRPVAAAIHSSYRHVISCSSSSSPHITIRNRLTLPSSRTAFSQNYWTHTFQNLWQWQLVEREWPFSGKKNKPKTRPTCLDSSVKTKTRIQEALRLMGNVILWEISALTICCMLNCEASFYVSEWSKSNQTLFTCMWVRGESVNSGVEAVLPDGLFMGNTA